MKNSSDIQISDSSIDYSKLNLSLLKTTLKKHHLSCLIELLQDDLMYEIIDAGMTALRIEERIVLAKSPPSSQKTYFIRSKTNGLIKIGKSHDPIARLRNISTISGTELIMIYVIDQDVENELHKLFCDLRVHGEWFRDEDSKISNYIKSLQRKFKPKDD